MKKLSLFFVMVLAATFAMAQNTAVTTQTGNGHDATVVQTEDGQDATIVQNGLVNTAIINDVASINQSGGNENKAVVLQLKGDENEGTVVQTGSSNKANLYQGIIAGYAQSGTVEMASSKNVGHISQIGNNNDVYDFFQLGNDNTGSVAITGNGNKVEFQQGFTNYDSGVTAYSSKNHATVTQTSDANNANGNNFAGMWQWGNENTSNITQNGLSNTASVAQGYSYPGQGIAFKPYVEGNTSNVSQLGNSNNIRFMQLGDNNTLTLTQNGDGNKVGGIPGTGLNHYFIQTGDHNEFTGVQNDGATLNMDSYQTGDDNEIDLTQNAGDIGLIQQLGNSNEATLSQGGGGQNAIIVQNGNFNMASVSQNP